VIELPDLRDLFHELSKDAAKRARFPIRFILVERLDHWKEVIEHVKAPANKLIKLSHLCADEDRFPKIDELKEILEAELKGAGSVVILPLSEYVRLTGEKEILTDLAQWELLSKGRVYIPLYGFASEFIETFVHVARYQAGTIHPGWHLSGRPEEINISVFQRQIEGFSRFFWINGIKNYMGLWENAKIPVSSICLSTRFADRIGAQVSVIRIDVFKSGYEVLRKFLRESDILAKSLADEDKWSWLASQMRPNECLFDLMARLLNVQSYSIDIFSRWRDSNDRERWLIWLWSKLVGPGDYLKRCLESSAKPSELEDQVLHLVFGDEDLDHAQMKERKRIVAMIFGDPLPLTFWRTYERRGDPLKRLKSLTGLTLRERKEVVSILKEVLAQRTSLESVMPLLELAFTELFYYLIPFSHPDEFVTEYFRHVALSNVLDSPPLQLEEMATHAARQQVAWNFQPRSQLIEDTLSKGTPVLWVDAMGLDCLGLWYGLKNEHGDIEMEVSIARANLPTTTEANKGWTEENQLVRNLDELAHNRNIGHEERFVRSLEVVKEVFGKAVSLLERTGDVYITSDHGLTPYSLNKKPIPLPSEAQVHKWGRFATMQSPSDDPRWIVQDNDIFLAVHGRFEGGAGASGAIHGGATLEEWLVPVIRLSRTGPKKEVAYQFRLWPEKISLDARRRAVIEIRFDPDLDELHVLLSSFPLIKAEKVGVGVFRCEIQGLRSGRQWVDLISHGKNIGKASFEVVVGMEEEDLGL